MSSSDDETVDSDYDHIEAGDQWRSQAQNMLNMVAPTGLEGSRTQDVTFRPTVLEFEEKRHLQILTIDSLHRDQRAFPSPLSFRIRLPRVYKNISRIDIVQVKLLSGLYFLNSVKKNTTFTYYDISENRISVTIPDGAYNPSLLAATLTNAVSLITSTPLKFAYNAASGRFVITCKTPFRLPFLTEIADSSKKNAYSDWGLGWNLGFGGQPADIRSATSHTASYMPRLNTDYIYLRLNDTENMNTIDNTDLEDLSMSQDTTGQTGHYFGKLLLNEFGGYAQTFMESPKIFQPVLSRLDRLSFDWVDRYGNPFNGPDALSCDWHMTVRIVEVKEAPKDSSTLIRNI
jgi:hypothetical protein